MAGVMMSTSYPRANAEQILGVAAGSLSLDELVRRVSLAKPEQYSRDGGETQSHLRAPA